MVSWGVVTLVTFGGLFAAGMIGVRSGRSVGLWTVALALSGAGLAAGALLVQDEPGLASWIIGPLVGAAIAPVHARALFAGGGPFRT